MKRPGARLFVSSAMALLLVAPGSLAVFLPLKASAQTQPKKPAPKADKPAERPTTKPPVSALGKPPAQGGPPQPVTINADRMEAMKKEGLIVFQGKVEARYNNNLQYADQMEVYLDDRGEKVLRAVSTGNVKVVASDCRTGTSRRAEYYDAEQRIVLIGNARVWQDENVVQGERITMFLAEDRSIVEGGKESRVNVTFYPVNEEQGKKEASGKPRCP